MASTGSPRRVPACAMATLLFVAVLAVLFAPVLSGRATIVHGDALSVSLPLQQVLARSLARGELPLWSDLIYGGHPLFAEGQGGFAHPLNLILFSALPFWFDAPGDRIGAGTLYAHGLLHVLCGLVAALGTFGLCRELGAGATAAAFAGLALACSQDWLQLSANSAIALSCAFAPATLLAVERWWQRPDVGRALVLGVALSAMLLAGYPQAAHAAGILALVVLLVRADRAFWRAPWRHVGTGLLAIAVAAGLSAIQLLPTLELVGESVRAQAVELIQPGTPELLVRGQLFSIGQRGAVEPGLGSLLVLALAGLGVRAARVPASLALGSLFLFQLAAAEASPLHAALLRVLPGLDRFRVAHLYATIGCIPLAVLAGLGVERLARFAHFAERGRSAAGARALLAQAAAVVLALALLCAWLHGDDAPAAGYAVAVAAGAALLFSFLPALPTARRPEQLVGAVLVAALLVEIALLRVPLHRFVDVDVLREPPATVVQLASRNPAEHGFKVANEPRSFSYLSFVPPSTPEIEWLVGLFLSTLDAGSNLLWGVPSLNANLALSLARRAAVTDRIVAEVRGTTATPPGLRFIDRIGLRYVVAHQHTERQPTAFDLETIFRDDRYRFAVRENRHARERLQLVAASDAHWVPDFRSAADVLQRGAAAPGALLLEGPAPAQQKSESPAPGGAARAEILAGSGEAGRYEARVDAREPVFLFVADAPYPGWVAELDGEPAPLFAADVLGKAVLVPEGVHEIAIRFEPRSFRTGLAISLAAALGVAAAGARLRSRRKPSGPAPVLAR